MSRRDWATGLGMTIAIVAMLAMLTLVGYHLETPVGIGTSGHSIRAQAIVNLIASAVALMLITTLFAVLSADRRSGPLAPLFLAAVGGYACVTVVLGFLGLVSFDVLLHGNRRWRFLADPETRLITTVAYDGFVLSMGAWTWLILRGRR